MCGRIPGRAHDSLCGRIRIEEGAARPPGRREMNKETCSACGTKHKERTEEEKKALITRLRKAEGQIRGIEKMVDQNAYCPDILIQVSAVTNALNSFNKALLACHIRSCVADDIRSGREESIDELVGILQKLMK